jgi:iron complex transport system ATP-binding protein
MLRLKGVSVAYEREVLKNINVECCSGEVTAILGRNGSGKSTLLRAILGDVESCGKIEIDGIDTAQMSHREKAQQIAVVEQNVPILPLIVREYIEMGRMPYRNMMSLNYGDNDKDIVSKVMKSMSIEHMADKRMDRVRGGERQLASVAQAIVQETKVLLLDEPTANLDIVNKYELYSAIAQMTRKRKVITLVVAHDISSVKRYADRVILLKEGEIMASGKVEETLTDDNLERLFGVEIEKIIEK